jgi:hypothetical protein
MPLQSLALSGAATVTAGTTDGELTTAGGEEVEPLSIRKAECMVIPGIVTEKIQLQHRRGPAVDAEATETGNDAGPLFTGPL